MKPKGLSMISIVVASLVALLVLFFGVRLIGQERAKARDAQRVADMARLQVGFLLLYNRTSSYAAAAENGCSTVNTPVRSCNLAQDLSTIASFRDPRGGDYLVTVVPDAKTYQVSFSLEQGTTGLAKGAHTLTPEGIK
jgi:hypothetical protein